MKAMRFGFGGCRNRKSGAARKMQMRLFRLIVVAIVAVSVRGAFGRHREIPDSLLHLFHNNIYFRYSHGLAVYLKDARNGYAAFSTEPIRLGMAVEPEIGTFVRSFMQIGIAYLYLDGVSEDTVDAINYQGYGYDDVFFSGGVLKVRYFVLNNKKLKIPIGLEGILGKCRLKSGLTDDLDRHRTMRGIDAAGDYEALGLGGGLLASLSYYPCWFLSIGIDAGIRVLLSRNLREVNEGWELPDYVEGGAQTMNLSSIGLKAYLSLQF